MRGLAILAVFVQHLGDRFLPFVRERLAAALPPPAVPWVQTVLHHAWWGVDLFFVVSGFSLGLSWLSHQERNGRGPAPTAFWARRARRILPAYLVALAIHVAARPELIGREEAPLALVSHLTLLQGYWSPGGIVVIGAAWSLTTEACFYLVMPLLAPALLSGSWRRRVAFALALCGAAWASRAALHAAFLEPGVWTGALEATQRRWFTSRIDQFVLGALAAAVHLEIARSATASRRATSLARFALPAAAALLVVAFRLEGALYLHPGGSWPYALLSIATTLLVLCAANLPPRVLGVVAPLPLRWLGVVSYGVFLYHQLALGLAGWWFARGALGWSALAATGSCALVASIAAGAGSWFFVEKRLLDASRGASRRHGMHSIWQFP